MSLRATRLGLTLLLSGCAEEFFLELPPGTRWVSVVQDVEGSVPPARLLRVEQAPVELAGSGEGSITVIGFDEPTLASVMERAPIAALETATIRGMNRCETPLPAPSWARRLGADLRFEDTAVLEVPALTSSLYDDLSCEDDVLLAEVVCGIEGTDCPVRFVHDHACGYAVSSCPSLGLSTQLRLQGDGRVCAPTPPAGCALDAAAGAHGVFSCSSNTTGDTCLVVTHLRTEPKLEIVRRLQVLDVPPRSPPDLAEVAGPNVHILLGRGGYLADLAVLSDRIVVASNSEYVESRLCPTGDFSSTFHFYTRDGVTPLGSRPSPACVIAMQPTADGRGFVALVREGGRAAPDTHLVLYSADGEPLHRATVPFVPEDGPRFWATSWLSRVDDRSFVASLNHVGGTVTELDRQTLLVRAQLGEDDVLTMAEPRSFAQAELGRNFELGPAVAHGGQLAVPRSSGAHSVLWLNPDTLATEQEWSASGALNANRIPFFLHASSEREDLLVGALGSSNGLLVLEDFRLQRASKLFEMLQAQPFGMGDWNADPRFVLVTQFSGASYASLYDTVERHYVPGVLPLGFGIPRSAHADGDTVWVVLPWEGAAVQIGPASAEP